jgi:hypothetical protein
LFVSITLKFAAALRYKIREEMQSLTLNRHLCRKVERNSKIERVLLFVASLKWKRGNKKRKSKRKETTPTQSQISQIMSAFSVIKTSDMTTCPTNI